jgi:protein SCO1/2
LKTAAALVTRRAAWARTALLMLALAGASALTACDQTRPAAQPVFRGTDITGAEYARTLSLPDQFGKPRSLSEFKGKVVLVFFGFTQCPDVCPSTLSELAQVKAALGEAGNRIQVLFVTLDPERDTPELLKAYMEGFDPSFIALRGTPEETAAAAKEFKLFYAKAPGKTPGSYSIDHTAGSYLFDTKGQVRLFNRYGSGAEALTADLKTLRAGS